MAIDVSPTLALQRAVAKLQDGAKLTERKLDNLLTPLADDLGRTKKPEQAANVLKAAGELIASMHYNVAQERVSPRMVEHAGDKLRALGEELKAIDAKLFESLAELALATSDKLAESEARALGDLADWILGCAADKGATAVALKKTTSELCQLGRYGSATAGALESLRALEKTLIERVKTEKGKDTGHADPAAALQDLGSFELREAVAQVKRLTQGQGMNVGTPGVLDHAKLDYLERRLIWAYAHADVISLQGKTQYEVVAEGLGLSVPQLEKIEALLPRLRELATHVDGGELRVYATGLRPAIIPNTTVRKAAEAAAKLVHRQRSKDDPESLNFAELAETLRVLDSQAPADAQLKDKLLQTFASSAGLSTRGDAAATAAKALRGGLEIVKNYMKYGRNGLLMSGRAQLTVGERAHVKRREQQRRVDYYQLPDEKGSMEPTLGSANDARELADAYKEQLEQTGLDVVLFLWDKKLYAAVNPHGDLESVNRIRHLQLYDADRDEMIGVGEVVKVIDQINSPGETHIGWFKRVFKVLAKKLKSLTNEESRAAEATKRFAEVAKVQNKKQEGQDGMGAMAFIGSAGLLSGITAKFPQFAAALLGLAAAPVAINVIDYMTNDQSLAPMEDLMGVTISGAKPEA